MPYGLSVENAFKMKELVFCNIMVKEGLLTIENLIESQDENRLIIDDKSEIKMNPIKLNRYDNLISILRK